MWTSYSPTSEVLNYPFKHQDLSESKSEGLFPELPRCQKSTREEEELQRPVFHIDHIEEKDQNALQRQDNLESE